MSARATSPLAPTATVAIGLAVAAGAGSALQGYVNGQLGKDLGSAELAATANMAIAAAVLAVAALATDATRRARRTLRATPGLRPWHFLGGVAGAAYILVMTVAAPRIGLALLTVGIVGGQVAGGLLVDRVGLSPAGRSAVTLGRVVALLVAVGAVALSVGGAPAAVQLGLVAVALAAGAGLAVQSAANGHLVRLTHEPIVASTVNCAVGLACLSAVVLLITGVAPPNGWSASPWEWTGGLLGAIVVTLLAVVVARLGVLRLMLAAVAGQAAGALAIDLVAPVEDVRVTAATVTGVALAFAAVALIERDSTRRRPTRAAPAGG